MKFRVFLGTVCLAFVTAVLVYGSDLFRSESVTLPNAEILQPTPEQITEISETISCDSEEISFATAPLVMGLVGRPATLLPFNPTSLGSRSQIETELSKLIFRGLVRFTEAGEPVPDLASWQVAEDGLSATFILDQGAFWHDGTPVTSADVAFTISTLAAGDFSTPGNFPWETVSVSIIDTATVQLAMAVPYSPLLEAVSVGLLPAHLGIDGQNIENSEFAARPIGNGDFEVVNRWETDGFILLEPVASTLLKNIELRFYPSLDAMKADLGNEALDLSILPTYTPISAFDGISAEQYNLFSAPIAQTTQLFFRMDPPISTSEGESIDPIADPMVRQALRLGLDRRLLVDQVADGQGVLSEGLWSVENRFHDQMLFPIIQPDLDKAALLLDEAGWLLPESDSLNTSIRQKDGVNLKLEILVANQGINDLISENLASQWADLGIRVNIKTVAPDNYEQAINGRQFDVTVQKIRLSNDPDLYNFWSQESIVRGRNVSRWNHRPASEALEAGRQTWDYELRKPYYTAFQTFFERELPAFTLFQDIRTVALSPHVKGQKAGHPGDFNQFMQVFSQWYILDQDTESLCAETS